MEPTRLQRTLAGALDAFGWAVRHWYVWAGIVLALIIVNWLR